MPHVSRKPSPQKTAPLIKTVKSFMEARNLSLRKTALGIGIGASHLSEILNGEKVPDAGVCNAIADFLGIPRVQAYGLAGWLNLDEQDDPAVTTLLAPFASSPEQLAQLKWIYFSIGDRTAREDFLQWMQQR